MLWRISVTTTPEAEDAVSELLRSTFAKPVCSYTDVETRVTAVSVYVRDKAGWSRATRAALALGLERIAAGGLEIGSGKVLLRRITRADWA